MSNSSEDTSRRVLDPIERISETLFGLIMVLVATGTLSVVTADRAAIGTMIIAALGCNLAWGVIDGGLYLMGRLVDRGRHLLTYRAVRDAADAETAGQAIADAMPSFLAEHLSGDQIEVMRKQLLLAPEPPPPRLTTTDWLGALAICVVVFLSTFPVVIPFFFFNDVRPALRLSNAIAIAMLFLCGYALGRCTGRRPLPMGLVMVAIGVGLSGIAILLGG
jgi:VIT1/CCC1 family predicted Fe2+/Mn2+ transporter